jgi:hypothetical protein
MDNYRHPMYSRYSRNMNMGCNRNTTTPCNCGGTPIVEAGCEEHCEHHHENTLEDMPLAMAYVPMQKWRCVTDGATGLDAGTIFEELVLPFYGDRNACGMRGDRS